MTNTIDLQCCGQQVNHGTEKRGPATIHGLWCTTCGRRAKGASLPEAKKAFSDAQPTAVMVRPESPDQLPAYVGQHMRGLQQLTAPYVSRDRPAMTRLIKNNTRYVMGLKGNSWDRIWKTPDGQQSMVKGFEDAMILGAELGKMGDLVPFGDVCEFIPALEAYEFAMTTGTSAPFDWINVECIYEKDQVEISRVNGSFQIEFKKILPDRGAVKSVAVYGLHKRGTSPIVIGDIYPAERLLEKARTHSPSYRSYLRKLNQWEVARSEGTTGTDAHGREYADIEIPAETDDKYADQNRQNFEAAEAAGTLKSDTKGEYASVELPKKGGGKWTKKIYRYEVEGGTVKTRIYRDEITNPYDGADRPEMLRKAAGKSFLEKYVKVRNSVAAMDEMREAPDSVDAALDGALDAALGQFDTDGAEDADYTVDGSPEPEPPREATTEPDDEPELF